MLQLLALSTPKTQAIVDQTLNSTIHRINHYPADKCQGNQLRYPLGSVIHPLNNWGELSCFDLTNLRDMSRI